jgi:hypothetical protein
MQNVKNFLEVRSGGLRAPLYSIDTDGFALKLTILLVFERKGTSAGTVRRVESAVLTLHQERYDPFVCIYLLIKLIFYKSKKIEYPITLTPKSGAAGREVTSPMDWGRYGW